MSNFSPSEAAFAGFRVIHRTPLAVLGWACAYIVYTLVVTATMVSLFGPQLAAMSQMSATGSNDPHAALAMMGGMLGIAAVALPLGVLFQAVMYAAIFRAVIRPEDNAFAYLRLGGDELRLIGLGVIQFFLFIGLYLGFWIAVIVAFLVIRLIGHAVHLEWLGLVIAIVAAIGVVCTFVWILLRLSLAAPMTLAHKRISVFGSWNVTKGKVWSLLGCYLLTFIFGVLLAILAGIIALCVGAVISGDWTTMNMLSRSPREAMMHSGVFSLSKLVTVATVVQLVVSGLLNTVSMTVFLAPFAEAYRELTGGADAAGPMDPTAPFEARTGALVL